MDALKNFAHWVLARSSWWWNWDLSWLSTTALGARQNNAASVLRWSEPLLKAYVNGCWLLFWTDDTLYWVAKPVVHRDEQRRLHCETGPAIVSDAEDLYFWEGTLVPGEWITDRASVSAKAALTWPNLEQRRIACSHIVGWSRILRELDARTIDIDSDPLIGSLVEVQLPDLNSPTRFCLVKCGTGRDFAICVPPDVDTALAAQAWMQGVPLRQFKKPEVRT